MLCEDERDQWEWEGHKRLMGGEYDQDALCPGVTMSGGSPLFWILNTH